MNNKRKIHGITYTCDARVNNDSTVTVVIKSPSGLPVFKKCYTRSVEGAIAQGWHDFKKE